MTRKLDDDEAFNFYVELGPGRSHSQVATKYGVTRRAITKAARRNNWAARLDKIEADARAISDQQLAESMAQVRERHLRMARAIAGRGVQALHKHELEDAPSAIKAIEIGIRLERAILSENGDATGITLEQLTRREVETYLEESDAPEDGEPEEEE